MTRFYLICMSIFVTFLSTSCYRVNVPDAQRISSYWENAAQRNLKAALKLRKIEKKAKNVIMFLGDGMGITTVTSIRIYKGQKNNKDGVEESLSFDEFPFVSLSKTYGIDRITSDSANTGTAYLCGVKANYGTIGVDGRVQFENCTSSLDPEKHVHSILSWAQDEGKSTGLVTTTRVTHATPASLYAHSANRNWEASAPNSCKDIAYQLVNEKPGRDIRVIMGGGLSYFLPKNLVSDLGHHGIRNDTENLISKWLEDKKSRKAKGKFVSKVEDLRQVKASEVDYLLGLFDESHLPYVADRPELKQEYPSLKEMTETAIKILRKNKNGFFLLVEGGSIDLAHHMNWAKKALEEGVEFDKAIKKAVDMTDEEDTLIVVTADHSHTFTIGGNYPYRGTNILGIGGVSDVDNMTFTTLGYHNGPGYKRYSRERNLTEEEAVKKDFRQDSLLPMEYETHGAEDVTVYAKGPMAHLFHGVHDQSYIPYVMGYASCVGPNKDLCGNDARPQIFSNTWMASLRIFAVGIAAYTYGVHSLL